jgi:hypothetical protein
VIILKFVFTYFCHYWPSEGVANTMKECFAYVFDIQGLPLEFKIETKIVFLSGSSSPFRALASYSVP